MTNLNDTGESIPAYHIDRTLYEGRPADTSGREDKEIRTYDLLDSLQVPLSVWTTTPFQPLKPAAR